MSIENLKTFGTWQSNNFRREPPYSQGQLALKSLRQAVSLMYSQCGMDWLCPSKGTLYLTYDVPMRFDHG